MVRKKAFDDDVNEKILFVIESRCSLATVKKIIKKGYYSNIDQGR